MPLIPKMNTKSNDVERRVKEIILRIADKSSSTVIVVEGMVSLINLAHVLPQNAIVEGELNTPVEMPDAR